MGQLRKYKVSIIEPSDVIARGLRAVLEENCFEVLSVCNNGGDFIREGVDLPEALLYAPSKRELKEFQQICKLLENSTCKLVAIERGGGSFLNHSSFDGTINIFESAESIASTLRNIIEVASVAERSQFDELSEREKEIVAAVAQGRTNKEIADLFNISIHTVITHRKNISHKTGINTIPGLTVYAIINKLVDIKDL